MPACTFTSRLAAYHDGELPRPLMEEVQHHLTECPVCCDALSQLRGISRLMGVAVTAVEGSDVTPDEVARMHAAVNAELEPAVFSLVGPLALVAASILVICSVWLMALPASNPVTARHSLPEAEWERLAMTLHSEPHSIMPSNEMARATADDSRVANWMVQSLTWEK